MEPTIVLKQKRADVLESYRHPWVFSKGLVSQPNLPAGTQVAVASQSGRHLGFAFYHPLNNIALRFVTFGKTPMDAQAWKDRIQRAYQMRRTLLPQRDNFRLIHGENDGFPGLTVDCYGKLLCLQINASGFENIRNELAQWLLEVTGATAVYEYSDGHARHQEGLEPRKGFLAGTMAFPMAIDESGFALQIDPEQDQKTGFYLDQFPARNWLEQHVKGLRVLDLCCYTGGFTLHALRGGAAQVVSLDNSARALAALEANIERNGLDASKQTSIKADLFSYLRETTAEPFDLVVLDPPSLAKSIKAEEKARNGYRQLNRAAAAWVKHGGQLLTFSCTGIVSSEVFGRSVFLGLRDSGREAMVIQRFGPGSDHPENLAFPEGSYLKGLLLHLP